MTVPLFRNLTEPNSGNFLTENQLFSSVETYEEDY